MSQQDAQRFQIALIQLGKDIPRDRVVLKRFTVGPKTKKSSHAETRSFMMDRTDYMKGITTPAPLPAKLVKDCSCLYQLTVLDAFVKLGAHRM